MNIKIKNNNENEKNPKWGLKNSNNVGKLWSD